MYARAETDHHIRHIIVRLGKRHPRCCGDDVGIVTGYTQGKMQSTTSPMSKEPPYWRLLCASKERRPTNNDGIQRLSKRLDTELDHLPLPLDSIFITVCA